MSDKAKVWGSLGAAVLTIIGAVFAVEKGYSNNPADPGGETNHGITVAVARQDGHTGPMRDLPKERAQAIYIKDYVARPGFEPIIAMSPAVGQKIVDAGVNAGTSRASRWFQTALNLMSRGGQDYPQVAEDGQIGPQTLAAYRALERKRGRLKACELVLKLMDVQQGAHYTSLRKPMFVVGWVDHRIGNVPLARCADSVREVAP